MGFFHTLKRVLSGDQSGPDGLPIDRQLGEAWRIGEVGSGADDNSRAPVADTSAFDRQMWVKKLKHILDELPDSRPRWTDLMVEAGALGFDPDWVVSRQREEFTLLVRRAVADRVVTEPEHLKIELARDLAGISEIEAEEILHAVVADAESFFGKPVDEG